MRPEICLYCDGEGNGSAGPCGFCDHGIPLDTQEDWDATWGRVRLAVQALLNPDDADREKEETMIATSEQLDRINEVVCQLADELGIRKQFAAGATDDYYEMLDDAANAVARIFWT